MYKLLSAAFVGLSLTACSGVNDNVKPPTELTPVKSEINAREIWDVDAGAGNGGQHLSFEPLISEGKIVTVDLKGRVRAFDKNNGKRIWEADLDLPIIAGVGGGAGLAIVGSEEGELIALSLKDGKQQWERSLDGQVLAVSDVDSGIVVARLSGGKTAAVDVLTGNVKWIFDKEQPKLTLHGQGKPLTIHGGVALGLDDGTLVMLQLRTGNPIWEATLATGRGRTELDRLVDVDGALVLSGEEIFAASYQGKVVAIDARNGRVLWSKEASSNTGVAVDSRAVYFTDEEGVVRALSRNSGIELWSQEGLKYRRVTRPEVLQGAVVVADFEGYLHWLDRSTGKIVHRKRPASSGILVAPKQYDDRFVVLSDNGKLSSWPAVTAP